MKRNSTMSLFAAMMLLTGSGCILMTSCQKDYDGQIEILRNQIENGDVNVNNLLEKVKLIEKQIETLQEAAKEHAEFKESISKLIKDLEATKNELEGKIAELQKAMEENDQNIKNMIEQRQYRNSTRNYWNCPRKSMPRFLPNTMNWTDVSESLKSSTNPCRKSRMQPKRLSVT